MKLQSLHAVACGGFKLFNKERDKKKQEKIKSDFVFCLRLKIF